MGVIKPHQFESFAKNPFFAMASHIPSSGGSGGHGSSNAFGHGALATKRGVMAYEHMREVDVAAHKAMTSHTFGLASQYSQQEHGQRLAGQAHAHTLTQAAAWGEHDRGQVAADAAHRRSQDAASSERARASLTAGEAHQRSTDASRLTHTQGLEKRSQQHQHFLEQSGMVPPAGAATAPAPVKRTTTARKAPAKKAPSAP